MKNNLKSWKINEKNEKTQKNELDTLPLRSMSLFFWEVRRPWLKFFDGSNGEVRFFISGLGAEIEN